MRSIIDVGRLHLCHGLFLNDFHYSSPQTSDYLHTLTRFPDLKKIFGGIERDEQIRNMEEPHDQAAKLDRVL